MCTSVSVDMCVKISVPATRDHLPRGDTLGPNRQCPLVAGTTVVDSSVGRVLALLFMNVATDGNAMESECHHGFLSLILKHRTECRKHKHGPIMNHDSFAFLRE